WRTANPATDYDWGGSRPGDNLYTSSVLALDADSGQLKWYYQEIPHDDWDYDSGLGESLVVDRDGKKLLVHQNKSGFVFVYDRTNGKLQNVWPMNHVYNWVKSIDPKTGEQLEHFRTGSGHRDGPISYAVNAKQHTAVPSGLGSIVLGLYPALWPEDEDFPAGAAIFVFTLK